MNVQEYISSGIIESCVLGLASEQERAEFEKNCAAYPEIKAAREAFEIMLEKTAMENAVAPPAGLKEKISEAVRREGKVIPLPSTKQPPVKKMNWLRYAVAASLILLAGSIWWNMDLRKENRKLLEDLNSSASRVAQMEDDARRMHGAVKMVGLNGTDLSPQSFATVYWDTASKDVYLLINNMPAPPSDQQYQLWALLNGQPVDMGVIEIVEKPLQLYRMQNAQAAQAFAITLEKKGGSPKPTLEKLYAIGNL